MALPFDRVLVSVGASKEHLSVEAFLALPLPARLRAIFEHRVEFLKGEDPIDLQDALRALRSS